MAHLQRVESMINVGCKYGPDDLPPEVWDGLIALAIERQFVDRLVDGRRRKRQEEDRAVHAARQKTGLPPPGQSLFPAKR